MTARTLSRIRRHPHLLASVLAPLLDLDPREVEAVRLMDDRERDRAHAAEVRLPWSRAQLVRLSRCASVADALALYPDRDGQIVARRWRRVRS